MEEEKNALPWQSYREYYYISREDLENIGSNSCFRVKCKLCSPALKTIGTNRSSSSNLRKHMKCIHPEALEEMDQRIVSEGNRMKSRRKRDVQQEVAASKRAKREDLLGGERELLFQLVEEFSAALECSPNDDEAPQKRLMWKSLSSTFNEISGGIERTAEELRSIWENLHNETNGAVEEGSKIVPQILTTCSMKIEKSDTKSYPDGVTWDNSEPGDEPKIELVENITQPIIMADENVTYASVDMEYQDESNIRQNGFQHGRNLHSKQVKMRSEIELRLHEQQVSENNVRIDGLKQQLELKREILKEGLEHQQRLQKIELVHKRALNTMERTMKEEAFRAEERRKEEKHAVEMSILRMSSRLSPQMRWRIPGINRGSVFQGGKVVSSSSEYMQDNGQEQRSCPSLKSSDKQMKTSYEGKKIFLPKHHHPVKSVEVVPGMASATVKDLHKPMHIEVNLTGK